MPLVLNETSHGAGWKDEWPLPAQTYFISSHAFETLKRELSRYVLGEVPGRSFLVAGHRGAGKTTMVQRAIFEVGQEIVTSETAASRAPATGRRPAPQRPLLVKVHGPSLFSGKLPDPEGEAAAKDEAKGEAGAGSTVAREPDQPARSIGAAAGPDRADADDDGSDPDGISQGALVHLTIALYRALAAEISSCYTLHARLDQELAGQLTLELDNAPDASLLRGFWHRIGRLDTGVLWPPVVGDALKSRIVGMQGMREIDALATAAQAFQVCSGAVNYTKTAKDAATQESKLETIVAADWKDLANKIFGLAAGALVGIGALSDGWSLLPAAAAGAAAGLLSTLTLKWTGERTRRSEKQVDYSFIKDRTTQTLDRDLPEVIRRVREAGLAPVFVLDELDKLDKPEKEIGQLVRRLKHLTTDFGFFCFLTDRNYYEYVRKIIRTAAFPREHTYFSHLVLVVYQAPQIVSHLTDIIGIDASKPEQVEDALARGMLGRVVPLRAQLNTVNIMRGLAQLCDAGGRIRGPSSALTSETGNRLAVAVQLAIEIVLDRPALKARMAEEPLFAQLALDAVYYLVRGWESDDDTLRLDRAAIVEHLVARIGVSVPPGSEPEDALPVEVQPLIEAIDDFVAMLSDFEKLKDKALDAFASREGQLLVDSVPITPCRRLLDPVKDQEGVYRFAYDIYGNELHLKERADLGAAQAEIERFAAFTREFEQALESIGLSVSDLVRHGVLPATIVWDVVSEGRSRLSRAARQKRPYPELASDLPNLRNAAESIVQRAPNVAALMKLAMRVAHDAGEDAPLPMSAGIAALGRSVDIEAFCRRRRPGLAEAAAALAEFVTLPQDGFRLEAHPSADSIAEWRAELTADRTVFARRASPDAILLQIEAWNEWAPRVCNHVLNKAYQPAPVGYGNLVLAARGIPPGALLRPNLAAFSVAEWSSLCLATLQPRPGHVRAPRWALVAALHALGFGGRALLAAQHFTPPEGETSSFRSLSVDPLVKSIIEAARPDRPAEAVVMLDSGSVADAPPNPEIGPIFALRREQELVYETAVDWLASNAQLKGASDERQSGEISPSN